MELFHLLVWLGTAQPVHLGRYPKLKCEDVGQKWVERVVPPGPKPKGAVVVTAGYACLLVS